MLLDSPNRGTGIFRLQKDFNNDNFIDKNSVTCLM